MKNSVLFWMPLLGLGLVAMYLAAPSSNSAAEAQTSTTSGLSLECVTLSESYKESVDLVCPDGATAVFGTCHTPGPIIIGDKSQNKKSFLVATEESEVMDATGLHCESSIPKVVAQLRCCTAG